MHGRNIITTTNLLQNLPKHFQSIRTGMRVTGPALIIESVCSKQQQSRFCKIQLRVITRNFDSFKWQTYK